MYVGCKHEEVACKASFIGNRLLNLIFSGAILAQRKYLIFFLYFFEQNLWSISLGNIPLYSIQDFNIDAYIWYECRV